MGRGLGGGRIGWGMRCMRVCNWKWGVRVVWWCGAEFVVVGVGGFWTADVARWRVDGDMICDTLRGMSESSWRLGSDLALRCVDSCIE